MLDLDRYLKLVRNFFEFALEFVDTSDLGVLYEREQSFVQLLLQNYLAVDRVCRIPHIVRHCGIEKCLQFLLGHCHGIQLLVRDINYAHDLAIRMLIFNSSVLLNFDLVKLII